MSRFLQIRDQHSKIFGRRFLNSQLSLYIGALQLIICLWSLTQHIYAIVVFNKILYCDFSPNSTLPGVFTGVDAIIFDIGLFHSLWGIHGCVAQHLDGGYGRFGWCVTHTLALLMCLPCVFMNRPKPFYLWPLLIQQSAYGIGLLILSLAALPRILPTFMGDIDNAPIGAILTYVVGTLMNFFLLYIYWHWYWHVEAMWNSVKKVRTERVLESHSRRTATVHRPPISALPPNQLIASPNGTILQTKLSNEPNGTANGSRQLNGLSNGHPKSPIANGNGSTLAPMLTSERRVSLLDANGDDRAALLRKSASESVDSPAGSTSSGCSSSATGRRRLPTVSARRPAPPAPQPSTMSLPIPPHLRDVRSATGLGFVTTPRTRTVTECGARRPSSARGNMEWTAAEPAYGYPDPYRDTVLRGSPRQSITAIREVEGDDGIENDFPPNYDPTVRSASYRHPVDPRVREIRRYQSFDNPHDRQSIPRQSMIGETFNGFQTPPTRSRQHSTASAPMPPMEREDLTEPPSFPRRNPFIAGRSEIPLRMVANQRAAAVANGVLQFPSHSFLSGV